MKYKCLSIAGFDGSGGAGIQADLKTFSALGCYGMTVLTALAVQNTCGVRNCFEIPLKAIEEQLEAIFDDIVPGAIKIGMLFSAEIIALISNFLSKSARQIPIVLDPVMIAKSGDALLLPSAIESLKTRLIPMASIITPNIPEAHRLVGQIDDFELLAEQLLKLGSNAVLLKGGHSGLAESNDLYLDNKGNKLWLKTTRIETKNTHGTGCTLSAAIAAYLALGMKPMEACVLAKKYLHGAIKSAVNCNIGHGNGPVHHFHHLWKKELP